MKFYYILLDTFRYNKDNGTEIVGIAPEYFKIQGTPVFHSQKYVHGFWYNSKHIFIHFSITQNKHTHTHGQVNILY